MHLSRSSGILLHITSLPGPFGIGDLGPSAFQFADFLHDTGQQFWQVLPLNPVGPGASPYSSPSTFAGNPLLISPEALAQKGLLEDADLRDLPSFAKESVDYEDVIPFKRQILDTAFERFAQGKADVDTKAFRQFMQQNVTWLPQYSLFRAISEAENTKDWTSWPAGLAHRDEEALRDARQQYDQSIRKHAFFQFLFAQQWASLRAYCHARGIQLFGDLPIYVAHDSADVWANQDLFQLDEEGQPTVVAGVPPDYFSKTGQRWGNPLYRWDRMKENGYAWWSARLKAVLNRVDVLRLDHFRGFEAYWEIPAEEETAVNGKWVDGPNADLFNVLRSKLGTLPLVAEDLGTITPEVRKLMRKFDIPGMVVLTFGLGDGPDSDYLPHHYKNNLVGYTGTHDTDTLVGWYTNARNGQGAQEGAEEADFAERYLNVRPGEAFHWAGIRAVMGSVADVVILPMQDVLGLDSEARMNTPGESGGNWRWRVTEKQMSGDVAETLSMLTEIYDRTA